MKTQTHIRSDRPGKLTALLRENERLRQENREYHILHDTVLKHAALLEDELEKEIEKVTLLSITDSLTGIINRKKISDCLALEMEKARRYEGQLSLIMFDIDNFKAINDRYGHELGDMVLVKLAALVQRTVRKIDYFGRWGGDEFMVVAPNTALPVAAKLAGRLGQVIKASFIRRNLTVTCSFGVVQLRRSEGLNLLVARADAAMFQAKRDGRDRVATATGGRHIQPPALEAGAQP
jgi:polar amino acid transport system substrate-binding protein